MDAVLYTTTTRLGVDCSVACCRTWHVRFKDIRTVKYGHLMLRLHRGKKLIIIEPAILQDSVAQEYRSYTPLRHEARGTNVATIIDCDRWMTVTGTLR